MDVPKLNTKSRQSFTLEFKMKILSELKSGKTQAVVAAKNNISRATIACMWAKKNEIEKQLRITNLKAKKSRKAKNVNLENALYSWYCQQRLNGIPVDGPILKAKALSFADELGCANFNGSNGWLQRFKSRFNLKSGTISGEFGSASSSSVKEWIDVKWPVIRARFSPDDIYNADESGLFFKMLPNKTYKTKADKTNGKKRSKERVTLLVCSNMNGSDKKKLLVIGKSAHPRKFPKNHATLPVIYQSSQKAWMTAELWKQWLLNWDLELAKMERQIILLIDNCSAHSVIPHLKYITIERFPTSVTSLLQPMEQGIIKTLKGYYRRFLIEKVMRNLDLNEELLHISLLDAIFLISTAWQSVSAKVIKNCFHHGLTSENGDLDILEDFETQNKLMYSELHATLNIEEDESMEKFFMIDNKEPTCEILDDMDLSAGQVDMVAMEDESVKDASLLVETVMGDATKKSIDVFHHLAMLRQWVGDNNLPEFLHDHISFLECYAIDHNIKKRLQSKTIDYVHSVKC